MSDQPTATANEITDAANLGERDVVEVPEAIEEFMTHPKGL